MGQRSAVAPCRPCYGSGAGIRCRDGGSPRYKGGPRGAIHKRSHSCKRLAVATVLCHRGSLQEGRCPSFSHPPASGNLGSSRTARRGCPSRIARATALRAGAWRTTWTQGLLLNAYGSHGIGVAAVHGNQQSRDAIGRCVRPARQPVRAVPNQRTAEWGCGRLGRPCPRPISFDTNGSSPSADHSSEVEIRSRSALQRFATPAIFCPRAHRQRAAVDVRRSLVAREGVSLPTSRLPPRRVAPVRYA